VLTVFGSVQPGADLEEQGHILDDVQIDVGLEDVQIDAVLEDVQTDAIFEDVQTESVFEDVQTEDLLDQVETDDVLDQVQTETALEHVIQPEIPPEIIDYMLTGLGTAFNQNEIPTKGGPARRPSAAAAPRAEWAALRAAAAVTLLTNLAVFNKQMLLFKKKK
jgi:hypothetical protein